METNLFNRLREWHNVVSTTPTEEDPEVLGGREAENFLHTLVQYHCNFKGASLFPNKRVPAGNRRREIDLIVVTAKRIHIIEVKNWSGILHVRGDCWIQINRNGREIEHPNLVADHQDKSFALIEYLRRQGISLDPKDQVKYLSNKVIFMNLKLGIQDPAIIKHPDILLRRRLDSYLEKQRRSGFGERLLGSVIQWCLDSDSAEIVMDGYFGSLTSDKVQAICAAVHKLATWDSLQYYGSRVETGDLIRASIDGETVPRELFGRRCHCPIHWTRNKTLGLIQAIVWEKRNGQLHLPRGVRPITFEDFVVFHRAGDPTPCEIPLVKLNGITMG